MKKVLTLTALGVVLLSSTAMASGFHLREQSAAAQGNAFAGATAGAENISYTYFNAAGLTRHKGTQINLGASYIAPEATAKNIYPVNNDGSLDLTIEVQIFTILCMQLCLQTSQYLIKSMTNHS